MSELDILFLFCKYVKHEEEGEKRVKPYLNPFGS